MMNEKITKLIELAKTDGFVSAKNDPYKEEKLYPWLKELQEYLNDKHKLDIDTTCNSETGKYQGIVFTKSQSLIGDLYDPHTSFDEKYEALLHIMIATLEYLYSPERCARCDSHHTHILTYEDNLMAHHCQDCGAVTVDHEMIGEMAIAGTPRPQEVRVRRNTAVADGLCFDIETSTMRDERGYYVAGVDTYQSDSQPVEPTNARMEVQPMSEMPVNDLGTNLRWQTSEDFFSEQMAELNRVTPFDEAEDGSTQYSTRRRLRDYQELNLNVEGRATIRTHRMPDSLRQELDTDRLNQSIRDAQAELDRLANEIYPPITDEQRLEAMRELVNVTGMTPINSTVNPNDDF
jgi:hypothetical protein